MTLEKLNFLVRKYQGFYVDKHHVRFKTQHAKKDFLHELDRDMDAAHKMTLIQTLQNEERHRRAVVGRRASAKASTRT